MFRVAIKINVPKNHSNCISISRQMSLAKRFLNANQFQTTTIGFGGKEQRTVPSSATSQLHAAGKQQKKSPSVDNSNEQPTSSTRWPRKVFSGIQPTGSLHLGNYLGAVRKWLQMQEQNSSDSITICIVDMHSITMPHNPPMLRDNIFTMAATLLACGIDPAKCTLFVQSAVLEHSELNWILSSLTTMPRLAQLPQFKEKSRQVRDVPLGLYVYPVLQAADIMLYKATHVPVGIDQLQHIQLAQHLARNFNGRYGELFPVCTPVIEQDDGSRVLSLRDVSKKMSKSDPNPKGTINLADSPEQIKEKIKKAVTDFTSDISYDPNTRPGVSNLVNIHAHVTNSSIATVVEEAKTLDTGRYKERVADAVIEHLRPIREQIDRHMANRKELSYMLEMGADRARQVAQQTMLEVKQRLGLGTYCNQPASVQVAPLLPEHSKQTASQRLAKGVLHPEVNAHNQPHFEQRMEAGRTINAIGGDAGEAISGDFDTMQQQLQSRNMRRMIQKPIVPVQTLRVEKSRNRTASRHVFKLDTFNVPKVGFNAPSMQGPTLHNARRSASPGSGQLGFAATLPLNAVNSISGFKYGQSGNHSALASVTSQANAITKQQELVSTLANSAFYKAAASSFNNANPSVVNTAAKTVRSKQQQQQLQQAESDHSESEQVDEDVEQSTDQQDEDEESSASSSSDISKPEATKMEN
ncbi:LOW QUALITY PROTEIN: uncharacterized protein LOC132790633 [Drosophila nasuta]|uniref:LOW QUALITY PROTEIN: uncharacterized protein LOC132790633 n=1 Tax=Drosophila nasuta TaxID=42062 RepID=UPI00295F181E|nr:LOW QUALITY PROTEIN: uncharacterized protein LOC132790633 [Drosophila nasuta]